jgi:hypothetical protein
VTTEVASAGSGARVTAEFKIEIPREKIDALIAPKTLSSLILITLVAVSSFLDWASFSRVNFTGWGLSTWFDGQLVFFLSLAALVLIVVFTLTGRWALDAWIRPILIVLLGSVVGLFIQTLGSSGVPDFGLYIALIGTIGALLVDRAQRIGDRKDSRSAVAQADKSFAILASGIGATFLPWYFVWGSGYHYMQTGWFFPWSIGKIYFFLGVATFALVIYSFNQEHLFSRQLAGLASLVSAVFCAVAVVKGFFVGNVYIASSSVPIFGELVGLFLQIWAARILMGRRLTSLVSVVGVSDKPKYSSLSGVVTESTSSAFCSQCGASNDGRLKFCTACGNSLT